MTWRRRAAGWRAAGALGLAGLAGWGAGAFGAEAAGIAETTTTGAAIATGQERTAASAVAEALARMPASTGRIALVPNLSRVAGRLGEFLAGINRAGMLLGADPVDQLMGLLGFSRHVDRFGAVAVAWVPRAGDPADPAMIVLVPSRDAEAFLDTNFRPGPRPGTVRDAAGRILRVRAGAHHVMIAAEDDAALLDLPPMGPGAAAARLAALGEPVRRMLAEDDVILLGPGESLRAAPAPLVALAREQLDRGALSGPAAAVARTLLARLEAVFDPATGPLPAQVRTAAVGMRFDPLGLLGRVRLEWREPLAAVAGGAGEVAAGAPMDPLADVPGGPMLLAGGWDRSSPVGTASLDRAMAILGITVAPRWLAVPRMSVRVPRHDGAFASGLLAGGGIRLHGGAAVRAAAVTGPWFEIPGWTAELVGDTGDDEGSRWRFRRLPGGGGTPGAAMLAVLAGGPRGLSGPLDIGPGDGGGAVTATLPPPGVPAGGGDPGTRRLARPFAAAGDGAYADDFAVALMRDLRPARAALEIYADIAAISRWLAAATAEAPMIGPVGAIDGELPPVGIGLAGDAAGVSGFAILPAPLAAEAWDAAAAAVLEAMAEMAGAPAAADDGDDDDDDGDDATDREAGGTP